MPYLLQDPPFFRSGLYLGEPASGRLIHIEKVVWAQYSSIAFDPAGSLINRVEPAPVKTGKIVADVHQVVVY
jgi:hypothetical protein